MKWEITIVQLRENNKVKYKVTRRYADYSLAETKIFETKEQAEKQITDWLD